MKNSYPGLTLYKPLPGMQRVVQANELRESSTSSIEVEGTYDSLPLPSKNILIIVQRDAIVIKRTNREILYIIRIKQSFELHYNSKL